MRHRHLVLLLSVTTFDSACGGGPSSPPGALATTPTQPSSLTTLVTPETPPMPAQPVAWDLEGQGIPRFIAHHYIELGDISRISRFRSGEGHDYSDAVEHCRSMKHYFVPRFASMDSSTIPVYAPVAGEVVRLRQEWAGVQVEIQAKDYPAFRPILFHVNATVPLAEGTMLDAGQRLGTHIGNQTSSDVAIAVDSTQGLRYVSWFEAITDALVAEYAARGLTSRQAAIITRAERDANPLTCNGEAFTGAGSLQNWVNLR